MSFLTIRGLPYGKTAAVMEEAFGLRVSRGGLCQALARGLKAVQNRALLLDPPWADRRLG